MCAKSSVEIFPTARGANGQPPRPPIELSKSRTPRSSPASALAMPKPGVLCKCNPKVMAGKRGRNIPRAARISRGLAMPVVSARYVNSMPSPLYTSTICATRSTSTGPEYGQPNAVPTTPTKRLVLPAASAAMSRKTARFFSSGMRTFSSLNASLAALPTLRSSTSAAIAASAPLTLGTKAPMRVPGRRRIPRITSTASLICGTTFGCTKLAASTRFRPVAVSASISSILRAVGMNAASVWMPSRAPTSLIVMWSDGMRSHPRKSCCNGRGEIVEVVDDDRARVAQIGTFVFGRPTSGGDHRARVPEAHPLTGIAAADVGDQRLGEAAAAHQVARAFLVTAADLAVAYDGLRLRIGFEFLEQLRPGGTDESVTADANRRARAVARFGQVIRDRHRVSAAARNDADRSRF